MDLYIDRPENITSNSTRIIMYNTTQYITLKRQLFQNVYQQN